jgi:hypothetical protein
MPEKNSSALKAWFWDDADTFCFTAKKVKKSFTSVVDNSSGSLLLLKH